MNYEKIYQSLIEKRQQDKLSRKNGYCEFHHIKPVSIYPELKNDKSNIVALTAREHFIAHLLLCYMYKNKYGESHQYYVKMLNAMMFFTNRKIRYSSTNEIKIMVKISSRQYENLRVAFSKAVKQQKRIPWNKGKKNIFSPEKLKEMVANHKDMHGKNNGMYGKRGKLCPMYGRKHLAKTRQLISQNRRGIPRTDEMKKQESIARMGNKNPVYGRKHMYHPKTLQSAFPKSEDVQLYLNQGYVFGYLKVRKENRKFNK